MIYRYMYIRIYFVDFSVYQPTYNKDDDIYLKYRVPRDMEYHFTENHEKSKDTVMLTLLYLYSFRDYR
jgi:hypothetical protein